MSAHGLKNEGPDRSRETRASGANPRFGQHRLKPIYMTQIGERPPRFAIQVNSRARVTRDYAYFLENRLRARYGMNGVPLVIDFVERGQRSGRSPVGRRAA
jgi:predicted GTPase